MAVTNVLITFVSSTVNKQQRLSTHPWSSTLVFLPRDLSAQQKCDISRKQTIFYTSDNTSTNIYEPQIKSSYWKWRQNPQLTERDVSVLRQCDWATNPCPEPDESSRHVSTTFLLNIFNPHLKFRYKTLYTFLLFPTRVPLPQQSRPNLATTAITALRGMQHALAPSQLFPIMYKYSPLRPHLENFQPMFFPQSRRQVSHL